MFKIEKQNTQDKFTEERYDEKYEQLGEVETPRGRVVVVALLLE
jgi:hypothetical protein